MKDRLKELRSQIEKAVSHRIDTPSRKRHLTYARAVYFKIGREKLGCTYDALGSSLNRDHATAIHSINVVFPFAMQEERFKTLYDVLRSEYKEEVESALESTADSLNDTLELVNRLKQENRALKYQVEKFGSLFDGLSFDEYDEVYEKLELFVKVAINNRVYR